jgi:hypothetical protein
MTKAFASIKRGLEQAVRHWKGKRVAVRHARAYEEAMRASLAEKPLKLTGAYPKREELYDPPVLRRR